MSVMLIRRTLRLLIAFILWQLPYAWLSPHIFSVSLVTVQLCSPQAFLTHLSINDLEISYAKQPIEYDFLRNARQIGNLSTPACTVGGGGKFLIFPVGISIDTSMSASWRPQELLLQRKGRFHVRHPRKRTHIDSCVGLQE